MNMRRSSEDTNESSGGGGYESEVEEELYNIFYFNPPSLSTNTVWVSETSVSPFFFYDKHLDLGLRLLHVKPLVSLINDISATVDTALLSLKESGIPLPPMGEDTDFWRTGNRHHDTTITS